MNFGKNTSAKSKTIRCIDGRYWTDTRTTFEEWVKQVGGQFAVFVEFKWVDGAPAAGIRTKDSWEPIYFPVPDDVLMTLKQCQELKRLTPGAP